jgi:hypothetical protein
MRLILAEQPFAILGQLLFDIGRTESKSKVSPPANGMTFLVCALTLRQ